MITTAIPNNPPSIQDREWPYKGISDGQKFSVGNVPYIALKNVSQHIVLLTLSSTVVPTNTIQETLTPNQEWCILGPFQFDTVTLNYLDQVGGIAPELSGGYWDSQDNGGYLRIRTSSIPVESTIQDAISAESRVGNIASGFVLATNTTYTYYPSTFFFLLYSSAVNVPYFTSFTVVNNTGSIVKVHLYPDNNVATNPQTGYLPVPPYSVVDFDDERPYCVQIAAFTQTDGSVYVLGTGRGQAV